LPQPKPSVKQRPWHRNWYGIICQRTETSIDERDR
jgi:hypothetical protein